MNLIRLSTFFIAFLFGQILFAQDSLSSHSSFQKDLFERIKDSSEYTALEVMISINYDEGLEQKMNEDLNQLYKSLDPEKLKSKKTKKLIKEIYSQVHAKKLKKYEEEAEFMQLFNEGIYNCVSATALYALMLDRFELDYEIRETPNHVYLIADPKGEKVLIETTNPKNGTVEYDYKTQKEYVNYLRQNKLISEEEYENTPIGQLFDKHFDSNKIINLKELAALLYYNEGIKQWNEEKYAEAADFFTKAYAIYPSANIHYMTNTALINALSKCENEKDFNPHLLADLVNLNEMDNDYAQGGIAHFAYIGDEWMVNRPQADKYMEYYQTLEASIHDSAKLEPYTLDYYWRLSYLQYSKQKLGESLRSLKTAYRLNSENLEIQERVFGIAAEHMMNDKNHKENLDSMDYYFKAFPFLKENQKVMNYYHYAEIRVIREAFHYGNVESGLNLLSQMEDKIQSEPNLTYDENYMAEAYLDLASYYARKENINQMGAALKRGLNLLPNSVLLQNRYEAAKQFSSNWNRQQQIISAMETSEKETFKQQFERYFVNCWENTGSKKDDEEGDYDKNFKIYGYDDDEVTYVLNGKTEKGTYSIRTKSRLLYLIPKRNKDDYIMYKVESINDTYMVLMPLNGRYLSGERVYMRTCN